MAKRNPTPEPAPARRGWRAVPPKYVLAALGGIAVYLLCIPFSEYAYYGDHDDFLRWGIKAADDGVLTLYDSPPPRWPGRRQFGENWTHYERPVDLTCNYPPIAAYVFWLNGEVHKLADRDRIINTLASRSIFAAWGILASIIMAGGVAAMVNLVRPGRAAWWAFIITLCYPPLVYDTAVWTQTDAWLLAPATWMVYALMSRRWILAGVLWGVMLGLKPQAVLFAPAIVVAAAAHREWRRPAMALGCAAGVLLVAAGPFMIQSGMAWWENSYRKNLLEAYPDTTLRAYNVWYADLLITEDRDATATLAGVSKDTWGKVFLAAGLAALALAVWRRRSEPGWAILAWTALSLLAAVMLPTRVHERYIVTSLPFIIAAAMCRPVIWLGLVPITAVALPQIMFYEWLKVKPEAWQTFIEQQDALYQNYVAQHQARGIAPAPPMEVFVRESRRLFDKDRAPYVAIEWMLVVFALLGSALTAWTMLRRPSGSEARSEKPSRVAPADRRR